MVILGLTLNKVFYKKRGSEHFIATLPLALKGWKLLVPHALKGWKLSVPHALKEWKLPVPTRPERAEAPSPGHRPGYDGASLSP